MLLHALVPHGLRMGWPTAGPVWRHASSAIRAEASRTVLHPIPGHVNSPFGEFAGDTRVSYYANCICGTVGIPEPSSLALLALICRRAFQTMLIWATLQHRRHGVGSGRTGAPSHGGEAPQVGGWWRRRGSWPPGPNLFGRDQPTTPTLLLAKQALTQRHSEPERSEGEESLPTRVHSGALASGTGSRPAGILRSTRPRAGSAQNDTISWLVSFTD